MLEEVLGTKDFVLLNLGIEELFSIDIFERDGFTAEGGSRGRDGDEAFEALASEVASSGLGPPDLAALAGPFGEGVELHWLGDLISEDLWEMLMIVGFVPPTATSHEPPEWEDLSIIVLGAWKDGLDLSSEERDTAYDDLYDALRIEWRVGGKAIGMGIKDDNYSFEEVEGLPDDMVPLEGASRFYSRFYPNRIRYRGECPEQEAEEALDDLA